MRNCSPQDSPQKCEIILSQGLIDQDDNIDFLTTLFETLQLATVEAADPGLDMITFAHSAHYFAVILEKPVRESENDSDSVAYPPGGQTSALKWPDQSNSANQTQSQQRKQRRREGRNRRHRPRGSSEDIVRIFFFFCALVWT